MCSSRTTSLQQIVDTVYSEYWGGRKPVLSSPECRAQARCRPGLRSSSAAAGSRFQPSSSAGPIHHTAGTHGPPCWWCGGPGRQQQWGHSPVTQHSTVRPGHCWPPAPGTTAAHGEMFNTPAILIAAAILISLLWSHPSFFLSKYCDGHLSLKSLWIDIITVLFAHRLLLKTNFL